MGCKSHNLPFFRQPVIYDPELFREFLHMHQVLEEDAPVLERESRLLWVLSKLIERYADPAEIVRPIRLEHRAVAAMVDYMHDNMTDTIKLEDLSKLTHLSKYYLISVFRDAMGLPPHAYLNQLRIDRAKSLLLGGSLPADAAAQVGFADQAHLTRLFKRTIGVTPGGVTPDHSAA